LPEPALFGLDLFRETLPERLFLLLELGVIDPLGLAVARLTGLHLLLTIVLVVQFLGHGDEVKHVSADKQRAQLAEVAVGLILDWNQEVRPSTPPH
jgi:hypothetical protein